MIDSANPTSSPNKSMRLFQMFSDEPANSSAYNSPSKTRNTHAFERASTSPEKKYNPHELLSYVSPFSPYLESNSSGGEDSQSFTDRYIPSRKLLKKDSLYQEEEEEEND